VTTDFKMCVFVFTARC